MLSAVDEHDQRGLRRRERAARLIARGAELTGPTAGGMVGLLGGPLGVLAGAGVGYAIREVLVKLGDEFEQRQLGPRQKQRAGAALYWALQEVEDRLEDGEEPRDDGFFSSEQVTDNGRADELLEAVLTRAIAEHEEEKLRHLGVMYGALVFRDDIKAGHGNFLVELASRLTWEQLVLIALIHQTPYRGLPAWPAFNPFSIEAHGVAGQLFDLARQGIIVRTDGSAARDVTDINPADLQVATTGCLLFHLMRLRDIHEDSLADAYDQLRAVADEPPAVELLSRLATTVDAERVTDEDLDRCQVRIRVGDPDHALLPAPGAVVEARLRGVLLGWTVRETDQRDVAALVPVPDDREEFFAVVDRGYVLRVSKEHSGELWLD
jgi:hypothetical protein